MEVDFTSFSTKCHYIAYNIAKYPKIKSRSVYLNQFYYFFRYFWIYYLFLDLLLISDFVFCPRLVYKPFQ